MSGLGASVAVIFIVVFQSGQITATFWQTAALPSDPDDPYYKSKYYQPRVNEVSNCLTEARENYSLPPSFFS